MSTISIRNQMTMGGVTAQDSKNIEVDNVINASESIAVGLAATAGAAGVMTLASGHGITDSDIVAVSGSFGYRHGCTVSAYDSTSITVASGAGDELPTSGAVVVGVQQEIDLAFSGTELEAISIGGTSAIIAALNDAGGVELVKSIAASSAYQWNSANGETNPVTGDSIISAHVYPTSTTAGNVTILAGYNNN